MVNRHLYTNRLVHEKSPYLLQHAHNPVDWYAWGNEAFEIARQADKPIFLSIGYATCHWCHVMERESFENKDIAALMNAAFVNIKVDREELPDVDSLYMEFAQSMISGAVGWPLNLILTPDLEPFFATTYLPPYQSQGMMGLAELIRRIDQAWRGPDRDKIADQAARIVDIFADAIHTTGIQMSPENVIEQALQTFYKSADPIYGGLQGAPKFPIAYQLNLLIQASSKLRDGRALFLAERTLVMMQRGGIYDHLGGGFSRYTVDERWQIPHFEKMLYDNALLLDAYLALWQISKRSFYRNVCDETLQYVLRVLAHKEGGFFAAEDADSGEQEGGFYTWSQHEVREALGFTDDSDLFCDYYNITVEGNFENRNILHVTSSYEEFAATRGLDPEELQQTLERQKKLLCSVRAKRQAPFKDTKIVTGWNGLIIHSLAQAGAAFNEPVYSEAAVSAARFLRAYLWCEGRLCRRWCAGEVSFRANLDDYAFLIRGLLTLFETGHGVEWLEWALSLTEILKSDYKALGGAFYQTDGSDPTILLRQCHFTDGAEPSGNAIHCENLLRLYQITGDGDYLQQAEDIFKAVEKFLAVYPLGYCYHLMNLIRYYAADIPQLTICCNKEHQHASQLMRLIFGSFIPNKSVIWRYVDDISLPDLIPSVRGQLPVDDKTTLYLCRQRACQKPLTDFSEMVTAVYDLI